jgi:hypothetical protein
MDTGRVEMLVDIHQTLMNQQEESTEESILQLISAPQNCDAFANLAEAGIDQLLQDGFLRDVPVLGSMIGVIRAAGSFRNLFLVKKLGRFLRSIQSIPLEDRQRYCETLRDRSERQRHGEALLLLLDRLDDMEKPKLVGKVFRAFVLCEIDDRQFWSLSSAIDRLPIQYLPDLIGFYDDTRNPRQIDYDVAQALSYAGLVRPAISAGVIINDISTSSMYYDASALGELFVNIMSSDV